MFKNKNALWNERENLIQSASDNATILGDIRAVDSVLLTVYVDVATGTIGRL